MKINPLTTALGILLLTYLSSCTTRTSCTPRLITGVYLKAQKPVTDTIARIIRCERGTDFAKRADSSDVMIKSMSDSMIIHQGSPAGIFSYNFTYNDYDYLIVLLPSGKPHKMKNIQIGKDKSYGSRVTSCSFGYNLDGKDINVGAQENETSTGSGEHANIDIEE